MRPTTTFAAPILVLALSATLALPARADKPGTDWMPLDRALQHLTEAGYRDVTEIEADDGAWEATATKDGARFEVTVDPRTGAIQAKPRR